MIEIFQECHGFDHAKRKNTFEQMLLIRRLSKNTTSDILLKNQNQKKLLSCNIPKSNHSGITYT